MKLNIHKKVLILVLGTGLVTFLVLGAFSYYGRGIVRRDMVAMSIELGEKSATYADDLLIEHLKQTLGELTEAKAQYVDREMSITKEDAEILANAVTEIMKHPDDYLPKTLPDPRTDPVKQGEPYRIYAPDIRDHITPEIQRELELAANIKDILSDALKDYMDYNATAFVGGEKGWYICARLVPDENGNTDLNATVYFSHERIYEFDPRKRPWYIHAKRENAPVISELYRTIEAKGESSYDQIGASAPFYDAAGNFLGVAGVDASNIDIYDYINKTSMFKGGINFVMNEHGEVVFSSQTKGVLAVGDADDLRDTYLARVAERMVNGEQDVVPIRLNGDKYYLAFAPMQVTGWSFGMVIAENEVLRATAGTGSYFLQQVANLQRKMRQEYSYVNNIAIAVPVLLLIILFLMSTNLSRRFVKPINELSDGVREIASGNLDKKLDIHTGDEIEHLSICFNAMTDELKEQMANLKKVTAEKERIATELDVATEIQSGMLPKDFPNREDFELLATMKPAKEVGGDFYDFYFLDETHLAITVADVSGKGIPAALFMVIAKTVLNNFATSFYKQNGLAPVVAAANEQLCANNEAMMFVTA
ncbi:MAG: HAMP domain-containing protein, partial [Selenomonadaceae bacterium]|nr:HAMP domain-containing protein [Selenomonadaceae bacterium]